ncbi:MAG: hypothetical protein GY833_03580 [Aestuariibacter sp.]|nr:hypothetical protein [Aestuariibacter sp.]
MQLRSLCVIMSFVLLSVVVSGCGEEATESPQSILGRWRVINNQGVSVPNSFFWFTMDYVEFREDGTVWGLMQWPPDIGSDIRLNKTAEYSLVGERQIEFVGACRHQDPCTGIYTATLKGDELQIFDTEGRLELKLVGPPSEDLPPTVVGPSPSPTPAVTQ